MPGCMGHRYKTLSIRTELIDEIDRVVERGELGYKSRTEFVSEAVRAMLRYLRSQREP
ncbi:MAG: ribbon-helix-helix domain-containing protein [Planctomycetota bacterium]